MAPIRLPLGLGAKLLLTSCIAGEAHIERYGIRGLSRRTYEILAGLLRPPVIIGAVSRRGL